MARASVYGAALIAALISLSPAQAQNRFTQTVYVEQCGADGLRTIAPAHALRKGDAVLLIVEWSAATARNGRYARSTVPATLQYQGSSRDMVEVSVDGGRTWGNLGILRVTQGGGTRLASPEDVTHLRWHLQSGRPGKLMYRAIVR